LKILSFIESIIDNFKMNNEIGLYLIEIAKENLMNSDSNIRKNIIVIFVLIKNLNQTIQKIPDPTEEDKQLRVLISCNHVQ